MLVMLARTSSDELDRFLSPMVYELTNNGAQVRFRRNDSPSSLFTKEALGK